MIKLKTKWQGFEYWQKGGLIGLVAGILMYPITVFLTNFYGYTVTYSLFYGITYTIYNILFNGKSAIKFAILTSPIFYGIIGVLIGLIIGKLRKLE